MNGLYYLKVLPSTAIQVFYEYFHSHGILGLCYNALESEETIRHPGMPMRKALGKVGK